MIDLFGNDSLPEYHVRIPGKRKAEIMHRQLIGAYGKTEGKNCKNCIFLKRFRQSSKIWSKCAKATLDGHLATDWRTGWQACGKFEQTPSPKI